jgi:hypothetical protein
VSRRDDERITDILDAAREITEVIELGRDAWDRDRIRQLAVERLFRLPACTGQTEASDSPTEARRTPRSAPPGS